MVCAREGGGYLGLLEASSGDMLRGEQLLCLTYTARDMQEAASTICTDVYIRFVFCGLLFFFCACVRVCTRGSVQRHFSPVFPHNSQKEQVRIGSAGGVPADNIFKQRRRNEEELQRAQRKSHTHTHT